MIINAALAPHIDTGGIMLGDCSLTWVVPLYRVPCCVFYFEFGHVLVVSCFHLLYASSSVCSMNFTRGLVRSRDSSQYAPPSNAAMEKKSISITAVMSLIFIFVFSSLQSQQNRLISCHRGHHLIASQSHN